MIRELVNAGKCSSHLEKMVSGLGAFLSILGVILVTRWVVGDAAAIYIIPSMGASAVLLFAVPHSPVGQPWNLLGGHGLSALVGVSCALLIDQPYLATALAVGGSVAVMYYTRCIHPPGGATAIVAVIGGSQIHALGYLYVVTPVLLNASIMLLIAVAFNYLFPWRRYPVRLANRLTPPGYAAISHEDLVYALSELDTYIDVTEADLLKIYELATGRSVTQDPQGG